MEPKYNAEDLNDHIAIAGVIKDSNGDILIQNHNKYGFMTIPVGKANYGQSAEDALKEELFEECNITVEEFTLLSKKNYEYERCGKIVNLVLHLYVIDKFSGIIENREFEKHSEQKFVSINEVKKYSHLSDATVLYLESLGFSRDAKL